MTWRLDFDLHGVPWIWSVDYGEASPGGWVPLVRPPEGFLA